MNPNNIRIRIRSRKHYSLTSGCDSDDIVMMMMKVIMITMTKMCLLAKQVLLAREGKTSEYSMQYIQNRYLFILHWQKSWIQNFT